MRRILQLMVVLNGLWLASCQEDDASSPRADASVISDAGCEGCCDDECDAGEFLGDADAAPAEPLDAGTWAPDGGNADAGDAAVQAGLSVTLLPIPATEFQDEDATLIVGGLEFIDPDGALDDLDLRVEEVTTDYPGVIAAWSIQPGGPLASRVYVRAPLKQQYAPGTVLTVAREEPEGDTPVAAVELIDDGRTALFALNQLSVIKLRYDCQNQLTNVSPLKGAQALVTSTFANMLSGVPLVSFNCKDEFTECVDTVNSFLGRRNCKGVPEDQQNLCSFVLADDDPNDATYECGLCVKYAGGCNGEITWDLSFLRGDPHLLTFDGLQYDMQAVGELTALYDAADDFEVQVRTAQWLDHNVAINSAVAMRLGEDRIAFYLDAPTLLNGEELELLEGQNALPGGGEVWRQGTKFLVVPPDGTAAVEVQAKVGRYLDVTVAVADERQTNGLIGLLGNGNGDEADDLQVRGGADISSPVKFETFYGVFAESWRVTPATSLFDYAEGEDTETFTDRSFPRQLEYAADLDADTRSAAEDTCTEAEVPSDWMDACVLDVGATGDETFASSFADAPEVQATVVIEEPASACDTPVDRVCVDGDAYALEACDGGTTLIEACGEDAPCQAGFCIAETTAALRGLVNDAVTDAPLQGVRVIAKRDGVPVAVLETGESGLYAFEVEPGQYELTFVADGYLEVTVPVEAVAGEVTTVTGLRQVTSSDDAVGGIGGVVRDSLTGAGAEGLVVQLRTGIGAVDGDALAVTMTDAAGEYSFEGVAPGNYTVTAEGDDYLLVSFDVVALPGETTVNQSASIAQRLNEGEFRIVLTWDAQPADLDSHLITPSIDGTAYEVYFGARGAYDAPPFALLDVDDTTGYGPETVSISQVYAGTYVYSVYNYSGSPELAGAGATVSVYGETGLMRTYEAPTSGAGRSWMVFELDGETGELTGLNRLE